jgi:hypothetical protein
MASGSTKEEATMASNPPPSKVKEVLVEGRKVRKYELTV